MKPLFETAVTSLKIAATVTFDPGSDKPKRMTSCDDDNMLHDKAKTSPTVTEQNPPLSGVMKFAPVMVAILDCIAAK